MKKYLLLIILLFVSFTFFGCNNSEEKKEDLPKYTVSFASDGVEIKPIADIVVTNPNDIVLPEAEAEGYIFSYWYFKLGEQNVTVTNRNIADVVKIRTNIVLYPKMVPTFIHNVMDFDIDTKRTNSLGEVSLYSTKVHIDFLRMDEDNADVVLTSKEGIIVSLSKRNDKIFEHYKDLEREFKYYLVSDIKIPEIGSSVLDTITSSGSGNNEYSALIKDLLVVNLTENALSITLSNSSILSLIDKIKELINTDDKKEELINFLKENSEELNYEYIRKIYPDFPTNIAELSDEEIMDEINKALIELKNVVSQSNFNLSLNIDINTRNTTINISFDDVLNTNDHLDILVKFNQVESGVQKLIDINEEEYSLTTIEEFLEYLGELYK